MSPRDFPRLVAIETTNYCNAKCVFCPNDKLKRGKQHMSDALFEGIIEQCREFPLGAIEPFLQGEPFSDPRILQRLQMIHARLPETKLRVYSNGYGLTPAKADALPDFGIDHLYISVNTVDPQQYQSTVGLKWERTAENLRYLTDAKRRTRVARQITFRMLRTRDTSLAEQDRFLAFCRDCGVKPFIVGLFNYKGDIQSDLPIPNFPCEHMDRLDILSNGKVTLCCMDQEGEFSLGDLNHERLLDVYRGGMARKYRDMHWAGRRREIQPCDTCNLFWPGLKGLPLLKLVRFSTAAAWYFLRHRPSGRRAPRVQKE
jgi:MoaA/NifB/PqqE/SkfB family radical SAM enzyme